VVLVELLLRFRPDPDLAGRERLDGVLGGVGDGRPPARPDAAPWAAAGEAGARAPKTIARG